MSAANIINQAQRLRNMVIGGTSPDQVVADLAKLVGELAQTVQRLEQDVAHLKSQR